jgi:tetratricopeptide (TPR) repeat protein
MHRLVAAFILQEIKTKARLESAHTAVETTMVRRLANELEDLIHIINLPIQPIHLRHITERALDRLSKSAGSLALVFGRHIRFNGEFDPAIKIFNRGLAAAQANGDIHLQGCLTVIIARTYFSQGLHQLSQETTIEAERLLRLADSPDKGWLIRVLDRRAWAYLRLGQSKQALAAAEETRQLSASQNDEFYLADAYNLLGSIYFFLLGEYEKADEYFEKAMVLFIKSGRSGSVSTIMLNQAESALAQGNYKKAKTLVQKAVPIIESAGKRLRALSTQISLSEAQLRLGEFQEARENLRWIIDQAPENWTYLFVAYNVLAETLLGLGQPAKALEIIQQVFSEMPMAQDNFNTGVSWRVLALIAAHQNQPVIITQTEETHYDAPTAFANSLAAFKDIENKREQGVTLWQWAKFEKEKGDQEIGQAMWQEAKDIFSTLNLRLLVAQMENQPAKGHH